MDGFGSVRVTSLFHCETGAMTLLINWLGLVELDLASTSAGGPVRVASLSPAKREVKREARKRGRVVRGNQTSLRSLVLSLVVWNFEFTAAFAHSGQAQVVLDICRPASRPPPTSASPRAITPSDPLAAKGLVGAG